MRYADLLIDLAAVVSASRSVASKHLGLRAGQLNRYGEASSIVRSLREQRIHRQQAPGAPAQQQHSAAAQLTASKSPRPDATITAVNPPGIESNATRSWPEPLLADQQEKYRGLAERNQSSFSEAVLETPATAGSPEAASANLKSNVDGASRDPKSTASRIKEPQVDAPPDADLNVFHTNRGSQILEGQKDYVGKIRPAERRSQPSWFKDFGHDKVKTEAATSQPALTQADEHLIDHDVSSQQNAAVEELKLDSTVESKRPEHKSPEQDHTEIAEEVLAQANTQAPITGESKSTEKNIAPAAPSTPAYVLRESKVPSTRLGRMWNYGGLAAGMLGGAISEGFSRGFGGGGEGSVLLSSGNMERLVSRLSRMRGAALKLGQMMSFQDSKMLPAPIQEVLQRVQDRADYMPAWQRDRVLTTSLGAQWKDIFSEFEETPIAAASIGQVHRATLASNNEKVAVKIQFPGVADSINSDLDNLSMLLVATKMLPRGLYLNKTIDNMRTELGWECDYEREAACGQRYRELLADEPDAFAVPKIYPEASGKHVLTMEFMSGVGVTRAASDGSSLTQDERDWIGTQILRLCLREIAEFRFMQTDPNWTNFLYNAPQRRLELLDFGASREFPDAFAAQYVSLLAAAARSDRDGVRSLSERLGYLTGHESRVMLDAHVASVLTLAEPFLGSAPEVYDFRDQTITERVKALIPVMVRERLAPPPEETYSLHRKLSGAFLLCAKLGSRVRCRELFGRALKTTKLDVER